MQKVDTCQGEITLVLAPLKSPAYVFKIIVLSHSCPGFWVNRCLEGAWTFVWKHKEAKQTNNSNKNLLVILVRICKSGSLVRENVLGRESREAWMKTGKNHYFVLRSGWCICKDNMGWIRKRSRRWGWNF